MMGNAHSSSCEHQTFHRANTAGASKKANICDDSTKSSIGKTFSGGSCGKGEPDPKQHLKNFTSDNKLQQKESGKILEKIRQFDPKVERN
jgi:hypothetical protein